MRRLFFLVIAILILIGTSLTCLSVMRDGTKYVIREVFYVAAGFGLFFAISKTNFRLLKNYSVVFYALSIILLVFVLLFGIVKNSSRRWIDMFGIFTLQPSEFAKLGLTMILSLFSSLDMNDGKKFLVYTALAIPVSALIAVQPDMGTALTIVFIYFFFVAFTLHPKYAVAISVAGIAAIPFIPRVLLPYQMERILIFFNPYRDPLGSGYNVLQSIIAIGSGRVFGKGLAGSTMTRYKYVPVQYADFIFSSVGEIFGFVGSVLVVLALTYIMIFSIKAYIGTENKFGRGLMLGIFAMLFFQVLINIGMTLGIMPVTGIPLPFVSYAGNSMIVWFIAAGLMASVTNFAEEITLMPL